MVDTDREMTAGKTIAWLVISILAFAVLMVNSAGVSLKTGVVEWMDLLTGRPTIYAGLAVVAMLVMSFVDLRKLRSTDLPKNPLFWFMVISILLCVAVLIPGFGANINGSNRWIKLGYASFAITFQPSELVKWLIIPSLAWYCLRQGPRMKTFRYGVGPALALVALCCGVIAKEDLGTAVLIGAVAMVVLLAGGACWWKLSMVLPLSAAAIVGLIMAEPYRIKRLIAFTDPYADPQGIGYHPIQSMIAIGQGGAPTGLGGGIQKHGYLPADTTDFIFPVIVEELGFFGGAALLLAYVLLILACFHVLKNSRDPFGRLVTLGVMCTIGFQAFMNVAVATVIAPTKGIALPMMSSGGTGWILCAAALGAVVAVDRLHRLKHDEAYAKVHATGYPDEDPLINQDMTHDRYGRKLLREDHHLEGKEHDSPTGIEHFDAVADADDTDAIGWDVNPAYRLHREEVKSELSAEESQMLESEKTRQKKADQRRRKKVDLEKETESKEVEITVADQTEKMKTPTQVKSRLGRYRPESPVSASGLAAVGLELNEGKPLWSGYDETKASETFSMPAAPPEEDEQTGQSISAPPLN